MRYRNAVRAPLSRRPQYHFSVDDVFDCLIDASDNYADLFDHPVFGLLKLFHERYGVQTDLYLFNQGLVNGQRRALAEVSSRFRDQFQSAEWLRFGPHARDYAVPPFAQTPLEQWQTFEEIYGEIERFAGPGKTTRWTRLHFFSESYELAPCLLQRGSDVLLLTDKPALAYRLSNDQRQCLKNDGRLCFAGLHLLQSHFRFELFEFNQTSEADIEAMLSKTLYERGYLTLFTHESDLRRESLRLITERGLRFAASLSEPADVSPLESPPALRADQGVPQRSTFLRSELLGD